VKPGETLRDAAFRETKEEWCGGRDAPEVEAFFASLLPPGFDREVVPGHVHALPGGWEFHTFLVTVGGRFAPKELRLNGELVNGSAAWFPAVHLPASVRRATREAVRHFGLHLDGDVG
jgi:hypothetical protein